MIILDIEASGVDPNKNSIVSIGAVDFDHPEKQYYGECRIWDGAHIQKDALEINGFTEEGIKDTRKMSEADLVELFIAWAQTCDDITLGGQNPSFDRDFIQKACIRAKIDYPFPYRTVDQHTLCFSHMIRQGIVPPIEKRRTALNSDKIMEYVGLKPEPHPHNALNGAKYSCEAIHRLLFDRELLQEFKVMPIPWKKA